MVEEWLYNSIKYCAEREDFVMNLDTVLDQMGAGSYIELTQNHPKSVRVDFPEEMYIKPTLVDMQTHRDSKIFLFSAPGATGKSALSRYIARKKHALVWDLSKEQIANHSFSGMLVKSLGNKLFSVFTEGLCTGESMLVIDALDEAEMISGRIALETLLDDLRNVAINAELPNIALCARTETAHFIREYYSRPESNLPISQYEISFFEESNAVDFITEKIRQTNTVTKATNEWIKTQFQEIRRLLGGDEAAIKSFIGYAPVLEALAVFFDSEPNTMQLLQKTDRAENSTEVFNKVIYHILSREHGKVVSGLKTRCENEYPGFTAWDSVYSIEEQVVRLASFLSLGVSEYNDYPIPNLPREIAQEYTNVMSSFLKDHPFIRHYDENGSVWVDFAGPAFRDYTLAKLLNLDEYDIFAQDYMQTHARTARFPSHLFFDFYEFFSDGKLKKEHFAYLYDAHKARATASLISSVCVEQVEDEIYCTFIQENPIKTQNKLLSEFVIHDDKYGLLITQLSNAFIDVEGDVLLGNGSDDAVISNSTVKCKRLIVNSQCVLLSGTQDGKTVLVSTGGIDTSKYPNVRFELRVDNSDCLKVSAPNVDDWFKLHPHKYVFEDETQFDIIKFENAVKSILKHFRKHGKDAPGRHFELIKNVIVGSSELKGHILKFFLDRGIIYQDNKDMRQFKLSNERLEALGVNWGKLSQNSTPDMKLVYDAYCTWLSEQ